MGADVIFRLGDNETGNKFEGKSKGERHVVGDSDSGNCCT